MVQLFHTPLHFHLIALDFTKKAHDTSLGKCADEEKAAVDACAHTHLLREPYGP